MHAWLKSYCSQTHASAHLALLLFFLSQHARSHVCRNVRPNRSVMIRSGLLCRNTLTSHSVCRDCGVWKTIAMKRLALPLERIWKTMEDKIECPTELDWVSQQISACTSRTPRQAPAAFNKQKHVGTNQLIPATANRCESNEPGSQLVPSRLREVSREATKQNKEQDNDKASIHWLDTLLSISSQR